MAQARLPTLFIPHGGGPCFFMEEGIDPRGTWDRMADYLRGIGRAIGARPKSVLVISSHWEEAEPTVQSGASPPLLFDYYGFPEHTYRLIYNAPGSPRFAARVCELLGEAGINTGRNAASINSRRRQKNIAGSTRWSRSVSVGVSPMARVTR